MIFSKKIKDIKEIKRKNNVVFVRILDLNNETFFLNCMNSEFDKIQKAIDENKVANVAVNIYNSKYNDTWRKNFWLNFDGE